jgi:hypothetical protein
MCSAESPAAPLSRSALRESRSYRPYPTTPPYPRHDAAPALLRARPLALRDGLPVPRREARGVSGSHSGSCLGCFAALARASRLAFREALNWFLRRLLISTSTFRRSNRGPCALSHGQPSSPRPRNLGYGISYAGACPPAPCSRCRISP